MRKIFFSMVLTIMCLALAGVPTQSQTRRPYRSTYQSTRQLILRIENRSANFRSGVQSWMDLNPADTYASNDINLFASDFDASVRNLADRFARREATALDAQEVLNRATRIDAFMRQNPLNTSLQNSWSSMRVDLNQLARAYNLTWSQSSANYPPYNPTYGNPTYGNPTYGDRFANRLTGTYRIDPSRSDDAQLMVERATRDLSPSERRRVMDSLRQRLDAPDQIAIDVHGRAVTLASTRAQQITFDADGRERIETMPNGRTIHARATLNGNQLVVSTNGNTGNDFTVTFDPIDSGQQLSVTRQVYVQGLSRPIVARSLYDKTSQVARFDIYNPQSYPPSYPTSSTNFIVPDGTRVVAVMNDMLSTRTAVVGDRFTLRVTDPVEFRDATIEGHVSSIERSGRLTGRSTMTLDFDSIRLRNGQSYRFAGLVESAHAVNGDVVRVDTEGSIRDRSQTRRTEERAAIGTAVGALIGAIAGGGKGAAIGAILGAGAGAGSVYVEGRDDLELGRGSEIVIRSGAPANTSPR